MSLPEISETSTEFYRNRRDVVQIPVQTRRIKPTRRSVSGIYPFRNETGIEYESGLERDFLIRTEFSLHVLDVIPQPVRIPFVSSNGCTYSYTPDFLVVYRLGDSSYEEYPKPLLVEVKPQSEWHENAREWIPKWKAAHRYAKDQGWEFHIKDESRIRDKVFDNIRFLDRYKRMQFVEEETVTVIETLRTMGSAPVHYLLALHFPGLYAAGGRAHLWNLLAKRKIDADLQRPLDDSTELWVPDYE